MTRSEEFAAKLGREDFEAHLPDRGAQIFKRAYEQDYYTTEYRQAMEEETERLQRLRGDADVAERPSKKPEENLRQQGRDDATAGRKPTWRPGGRTTPEGRKELDVEYMEGYREAQEQMAKDAPANDHRGLGGETDADREAEAAQARNRAAQEAVRQAEAALRKPTEHERLDAHDKRFADLCRRHGECLGRLEKVEKLMHPPADPRPEVDARIRAALGRYETNTAGDMARRRITALEDRATALNEKVERLETDGVANDRVKAVEHRLSRQQEQISMLLRGVRKAKKLARRALRLLVGRSSMTDLRPPLLDQHFQDAAELRGRVRKLEEGRKEQTP